MRSRFEKELKYLNDELIEMGNLIESSINAAVAALKETGYRTGQEDYRKGQ